MNNLTLINRIIETKKPSKERPIKIHYEGGYVILDFMGETFQDVSLHECIERLKVSLLIRHLDDLDFENLRR